MLQQIIATPVNPSGTCYGLRNHCGRTGLTGHLKRLWLPNGSASLVKEEQREIKLPWFHLLERVHLLNLGRSMWTKRSIIHVCWSLGVIIFPSSFDACSDLLRRPNIVAKCYLIRTLS